MSKLYECNQCKRLVIIRSKGLCPACRGKQLGKKKKGASKTNSSFFDRHIEKLLSAPYSFESGAYINNPDRKNVCHLLPKRAAGGFPSLAKVDENIVYLTWQEHHDLDRLIDSNDFDRMQAIFPNTWKYFYEKLPDLLELCQEKNKMYFRLKEYLDE